MAKNKKLEAEEKLKIELEAEEKLKIELEAEETFVMLTTFLSWGAFGKNHFYSDKKPLISRKKLGSYSSIIDIWLKVGWIEKGSYS